MIDFYGIWVLFCWSMIALTFVWARMRIPFREFIKLQYTSGPLLKPEEVKVDAPRFVKHTCVEKTCTHFSSPTMYKKLNVEPEAYWLEHWWKDHNSLAPQHPYVEEIHEA